MQSGFFEVVTRARFEEFLAGFAPLARKESVGLDAAFGRVLASCVTSGEDLPLGARSSMDGFCVRARDAFGATESNPQYLECVRDIGVSEFPDFALAPGECARIPTGGYLPQGADSVVMVEHTGEMGGTTIEIRRAVAPGDNVMERGEDVPEGGEALPAGRRLGVAEVGLLAALGMAEVQVLARPRVAVLSTGDELTGVAAPPTPGKVRDVNSLTVSLLAARAGAEPVRYGIVRDDLASLSKALDRAWSECDAVFLSGGSSVGVRDLTVEALEGFADTSVLCHGVNISPGKPTILADRSGKPVIGLPGQIGSALVVMAVLGAPLLGHIGGDALALAPVTRPVRRAVLARNVASKPGREDFVRVRLEARPGALPLAHPVLGRSGLLRTLVASQGLAMIAASSEGGYQGEEVDVLPF